MKIKYSKRRLFSNFLLGALFTLWGAVKWFEGTASYFTYFQLAFGILVVGSYFFERRNQYLRIKKGFLTKNSFRGKTIQLDEVEKIQSFPGKIKLFTSEEEISINTGIIEEESLKDLYRLLGSLELEPKENPFIGWSNIAS